MATRKDLILIVDDEPLNRVLLESILSVLDYESRSASNGPDALQMLDEEIDLILLDVNMPEITGFEVARRVRSAERCHDVPIIMVTALNSMQDRLTAVEAGANDFICKPVDQTELRIRVASQLKVKHAQDAVKRHHAELETKVEQRTQSLQEANEKLARLATTDALTGLANHRSLVASLEMVISECVAAGTTAGVLFIDLDHFKAFNDSLGHAVGDAVLIEFGEVLTELIGNRGVCGRWGGEEFVCILAGADSASAEEFGEDIRRTVAQHSFKAGAGSHLTCSIGVAISPHDGKDRSTIAEAADKAMYVAKALGRNQVRAASDITSSFSVLVAENTNREDLALEGLVEALMSLVQARDEVTALHTKQVKILAMRLAQGMGLSHEEVQVVGLVGKLHDIGKVAVPDAILGKPGPLTPDEWSKMKEHPIIGAEVVSRVPTLRAIAPALRAHHERWDGAGYPDGLSGEAIPLAAQIVAVADAYSAMVSERPYREPMNAEEAIAELRRGTGTQFSPAIIAVVEKVLGPNRMSQAA